METKKPAPSKDIAARLIKILALDALEVRERSPAEKRRKKRTIELFKSLCFAAVLTFATNAHAARDCKKLSDLNYGELQDGVVKFVFENGVVLKTECMNLTAPTFIGNNGYGCEGAWIWGINADKTVFICKVLRVSEERK